MRKILILINICTYLAIVNAHGWLSEPPNRLFDPDPNNIVYYTKDFIPGKGGRGLPLKWTYDVAQQLSNPFVDRFYYYDGPHICGQNNGEQNGPVDVGKNQPPRRTYLSGTKQQWTSSFDAGHYGAFTIRLCKLNSSTDIPTQACFDQEVIKITPISPLIDFDGISVVGDDHTIRTNNKNIPIIYNFTAQLPPGLTCDHCVLQWEWQAPDHCFFRNGSGSFCGADSHGPISPKYRPEINGFMCHGELRRNCADIKIVANPDDTAVYKPNPMLAPNPDFPKVFRCFREDRFSLIPNTNPDPLKYIGVGVNCNIDPTYTAGSCDDCRLNCMTPDKTCPEYCSCRWFPRNFGGVSKWTVFWTKIGSMFRGMRCVLNPDRTEVTNSITTQNVTLNECEAKCINTDGCSYYQWTKWSNSRCVINFGNVQQSDAIVTGEFFDICGINTAISPNPSIKPREGYLGCYRDNGVRDLSGPSTDTPTMTIENCVFICKFQNYLYAGIQAGGQCYCGNSYGSYGKSICNTKCRGNSTQICGGDWANSVYDVSVVSKLILPVELKSTYKGCYGDDGNRDLPTLVLDGSSIATVEYCSYLCYSKNFSYVGIQAGSQCWCGNSYGKYGQFPNDCNSKCSGNKNQECGGGWRNSIYSLLSDDIPTDIGSTRGIACEGQTLNLQCPQSQNLNIVSAYYGRTDSKMCGIWPNTIIKSDQLVYFQSKCNNNNSCSAIASNGLFGDICGGIRKYLDVQYTCA